MNLYNMMFGVNNAAPMLLAALNLNAGEIERFRDCWIEADRIAVHTRTGGGNRDEYPNEVLTSHPLYQHDVDDDFDSTYATYYFAFPDEYAEDLKALAAKSEIHTPSEKWQALFDALARKP